MTKTQILLLIPLTIIGGFLAYSWTIFCFTDIVATWRHYLALSLFIVLIYLFFTNLKKATLGTGIYLILGTINLLTLTTSVTSNSFGVSIGSIELWTPAFQLLSFGLFILYFILNFDMLVEIQLDYKEARQRNKERRK